MSSSGHHSLSSPWVFAYYIIFVLLPVTGPQYYYGAAGMDNIAHGIFPNVHDYFNSHQERLVSPATPMACSYHLVVDAHNAGERPTAAFPSSHVGISTVILLFGICIAAAASCFSLPLPFFILMCFSTVYIQAHYAIDAIAGLIMGQHSISHCSTSRSIGNGKSRNKI